MAYRALARFLRSPEEGPRVVVIGGGTGLSTMLRGLKRYTQNLTAIVTVADDGGSSGILRRDLGILPPGDIRNCIMALADVEPVMESLLNHRFQEGSLANQSFGNLFIAAMIEVCGGNINEAVRNMSRVLAVTGTVLPVSLCDIEISARLSDGRIIRGESHIGECALPDGVRIESVTMTPATARPLPEALEAIAGADLIVLGPGSLYTSIIPNLLFPELVSALADTVALRVYVTNVMQQPEETRGYTAADHLRALLQTCGRTHAGGFIDYCIMNEAEIADDIRARYRASGADIVVADRDAVEALGAKAIVTPLAVPADGLVRHDAARLARELMSLAVESIERQVAAASTRIYRGLEE